MADSTSVDPQTLRDAATNIGNIMNDDAMSVFNALDDQPPSAGVFPTGEWLHDRAADRITAVQQQAQILKNAFADICTGLNKVADDLENTDADNASQLTQDVGAMETNVTNDTSGIGGYTSSGDSTTGDGTSRVDPQGSGSGSGDATSRVDPQGSGSGSGDATSRVDPQGSGSTGSDDDGGTGIGGTGGLPPATTTSTSTSTSSSNSNSGGNPFEKGGGGSPFDDSQQSSN